ncbi:unnamed protein product [Acanthoscelides obtectus]|uniref:Uncharacterized protein n=1 Tax=Acanthoscelides obtectus TaxID=200917 RepID=A0A9P0PN88_ACAOB|nr:unnamed protein product [Acanthoscelides obtectus]CAK1660238.1 hypothetical protein AOBTE_LOCUS21931 [Acanthoscelides obtectus]
MLTYNLFMKITVESSQNDFMFLWVVYSIGLLLFSFITIFGSFRVWYSIICFCSNCPNQSLKEKIAIDGPNGL